jgi:hypothetical protein
MSWIERTFRLEGRDRRGDALDLATSRSSERAQ